MSFPGPPAAPGVRVSTHRALHVPYPLVSDLVMAAGVGVQGGAMVLPR